MDEVAKTRESLGAGIHFADDDVGFHHCYKESHMVPDKSQTLLWAFHLEVYDWDQLLNRGMAQRGAGFVDQ
jgi:hypothetical protein